MPAGGLVDLAPAVLRSLGVASRRASTQTSAPLALPSARRVCLLLVDGLGELLLAEHADSAPTLAGLRSGRLSTGYPSSTPTSLATLSTGLPAGTHGVVGVTTLVDEVPLTTLGWQVAGVDARGLVQPERLQHHPTVFEQVTAAGLPALQVAPAAFDGTGFTEAILRGSDFRGLRPGDRLAGEVLSALQEISAGFVYGYTAALDTAGHLFGPGSPPWLAELVAADALVAAVVDRLPAGTLLVVTGDHGMVAPTDRLDLDARPDLLRDVDLVTGEARALSLHTRRPQAVLERWCTELGDRAEVALRADGAAWFGATSPEVLTRLGDVLVRCGPDLMVVRSLAEPKVARLVGMHGGATPQEALVPLLTHLA